MVVRQIYSQQLLIGHLPIQRLLGSSGQGLHHHLILDQLYKLDKHLEHALSIQSFYSKLRLVILRVKRLYANLSIIISFGSSIQREPCQRRLLLRADSWYARDESHVQSIQRVASVYADPLDFLTPSLESA